MPETTTHHDLNPARTLRLILGDQLNIHHPWLATPNANTLFLMAELPSETSYVNHHIQKVVAFFVAMRLFAAKLRQQGHRVHYICLDDSDNPGSFTNAVQRVIEQTGAETFGYQWPDEYRLDLELLELAPLLKIKTEVDDTHHFFTSRFELSEMFSHRKTFLMEHFYRTMRGKHKVLMEDGQPVTGRWNYDEDNRHKLPDATPVQPPKTFLRDVTDVLTMIKSLHVETIGSIDAERFIWPVTREEGLELLGYFIDHLLPRFGTYQDAMSTRDWSLFHSRLSFVLNTKLIGPVEVVKAVERRWYDDPDHASIAQVEGFIRQILGWREYMRGVYWAKMPDFATLNFFGHDRELPKWFWTGETHMNCMRHAVGQSLEHAYAHHIQRLMVTGNFALLAGIHPDEVDRWYLGVYIDAIEWVEITNTRGMSQFADGGIVGSKPYVASANYIKKMGNYCDSCTYDHKKRAGDGACPLNSLYWHFYARNRALLERNQRISMVYRTWDKMDALRRSQLLDHAETVLQNLDDL